MHPYSSSGQGSCPRGQSSSKSSSSAMSVVDVVEKPAVAFITALVEPLFQDLKF